MSSAECPGCALGEAQDSTEGCRPLCSTAAALAANLLNLLANPHMRAVQAEERCRAAMQRVGGKETWEDGADRERNITETAHLWPIPGL